jgi:predicted amidophosphoribosyltransferase
VVVPRDLDDLLATASGFGGCPRCKYFQGGWAALCHRCASRKWEALADDRRRCQTCDLPFATGEKECHNPVCALSERYFEWNYAIAMRTGVLKDVISDYKYHDRKAWASIFGRILVGFLDAHRPVFEKMDLLIPSPAYTGDGAHRSWNHISEILAAAARESEEWPFDLADPPAVVKLAETEQMVGKTYQQRKVHAQGFLREALAVTNVARTRNKSIVVVDDVFTDGLTLNEVARVLKVQGEAAAVVGVTLSRQPWRRS